MESRPGLPLCRSDGVVGTERDQGAEPSTRVSEGRLDRLLLIVQSAMQRQCLQYMLRSRLPACEIESVASVSEASAARPAVVLLEIASAARWTGGMRDQVAKLQEQFSGCPILILSSEDDAEFANLAIRSGVRGFLLPTATIETVVAAIGLAVAGGVYVPSALIELWTAGTASSSPVAAPAQGESFETLLSPEMRGFTGRELEVLQRLHQGKPNKIIAYDLKMSESTVKVHMRNIMRKLSATNRTQVASLTREAFGRVASSGWDQRSGVRCRLDLKTGSVGLAPLDIRRLGDERGKPMQ